MLAIAVAFEREIRDYLYSGGFRLAERNGSLRFFLSPVMRDVVVVEGGCGPQLGREAARLVIEKCRPDLLVSIGFAAAAKPDMSPGDVYICQRLLALRGEAASWSRDAALEKTVAESALPYDGRNDFDVRRGSCVTMPGLVSSSSMKRWLGSNLEADLIDMESFDVSEVADEHDVPALIVRAVFDPMEQTHPPFVAQSLESSAAKTALRASAYTFFHPASLGSTLSLRSQAKVASASLSRFLLGFAENAVASHKQGVSAK